MHGWMEQAHAGLLVPQHNPLEWTTIKLKRSHQASASNTEQASRANASGLCEVAVKVSLYRTTAKRRYRSASGRREAGESGTWEYNDHVKFSEAEAAKQTKNPFLHFFRLAAGGLGGAAQK